MEQLSADTDLGMLKKLLVLHERERTHAYKDTKGYTTIGIGRCVELGVGPGLRPDEIELMFRNDMEAADKELSEQFAWYLGLSDVRRAVLIDLYHQLGMPKLLKFTKFLLNMKRKYYQAAGWEIVNSRLAPARANRLKAMMISDEWPKELLSP